MGRFFLSISAFKKSMFTKFVPKEVISDTLIKSEELPPFILQISCSLSTQLAV